MIHKKKNNFFSSVSLWRRANARNIRLYYPYWQYIHLFVFRFVPIIAIVIRQQFSVMRNWPVFYGKFSRYDKHATLTCSVPHLPYKQSYKWSNTENQFLILVSHQSRNKFCIFSLQRNPAKNIINLHFLSLMQIATETTL